MSMELNISLLNTSIEVRLFIEIILVLLRKKTKLSTMRAYTGTIF